MPEPASSSSRAPEWPLAAIRIYLGVVFVVAGMGQLAGVEPWGPRSEWAKSLLAIIAAMGSHVASFYDGFFRSVLVPHEDFLGTLMPLVHIAVGVPLIVGVGTRLAAGTALFCLVNYMAMLGFMPYHPNPISALAALTTPVLFAGPEDVWSIRATLVQRWHNASPA
jgi:uncharacterized membrane protein YphA (DoxX/SURF4 family)